MEENSIDSGTLDSSGSLSLPSEPPDIRNWFSSYKYESFVLDTHDDAFRTTARDDFSIDDEKIRADDGGLSESLKTGEVPDSSYSQTVLHEPHHPENWLLTCVSETCGDGFEAAASQCKEDAFAKEGIDRDENFKDSKSKSSDLGILEKPSPDEFQCREESEDCPSQEVPELHHPENWLSTYVSETCDELETAISQDRKDEEGIDRKANFGNLESKSSGLSILKGPSSDEFQLREGSEDGYLQKVPYSQLSSEFLSEPPHIRNWFSSYAYESPVLSEEINDVFIDQERKADGEMNYQSIDKSTPNTSDTLDGNKVQNSISKSPTKLTPFEDSGSLNNLEAAESNEAPSASGFVTTRKNKIKKRLNNDENSFPGFKSERSVSWSAANGSLRNRKVLSERTNVVAVEKASNDPNEVTGKWKCPQRSKPDKGPPMKQLRLERWVTKL